MEKLLTCAFTGHRNLNGLDFDYERMRQTIYSLLEKGYTTFFSGMALGFDVLAAECLLEFRSQFKFKLIAVIPCVGQADRFSRENKERYKKILAACDDYIVLNDEYFSGCMQQRDRYMVDNCDVLVSFLRRKSGGTFYTVNYAKRQGKPVIEL